MSANDLKGIISIDQCHSDRYMGQVSEGLE
jgi:hypothetical protein